MWRDKAVAAGLIAVLLLTGCGSEAKKGKVYLYTGKAEKKEEEHYETCTVKKEDFTEEITESGEVEYTSQETIVMDVGNATLESIKIKEGQMVKKGQVVATYYVELDEADMERQKLELNQRRKEFNAQLKMKQNALKESKRQLDAMKNGNDKKIKKIEYEKQKKEFEQFKASESEIKESEKDYASLLADAKKTKLVSKISGEVISLGELTEGDPLESGTVIATVQKSGDFNLKAEDSAGALRYNMEVDVWLGGDRNDIRYKLKGKIASANNLTDTSSSQLGEVYGESEDSGSEGVYVKISKADKEKYDFERNNVYIHYETKRMDDALLVDNDAIYSELEGETIKNYVYLVSGEKLYKRYVVVGFSNEEVTVVEQGVEEGQELAKNVVEDSPTGAMEAQATQEQ